MKYWSNDNDDIVRKLFGYTRISLPYLLKPKYFNANKTLKLIGAMSAGGSPGSPSQCSGLGGLIGGHNSDLNNQGIYEFYDKRPKTQIES